MNENKVKLSSEKQAKYQRLVDNNIRIMNENIKSGCNLFKHYHDPDKKIEQMWNGFRLAPDGICGVTYLHNYLHDTEVMKGYQIIRSFIVLWPRHRSSINQRRFGKYRDRFDFTLFDISLLFKEFAESAKAHETYYLVKKDSVSYNWLIGFENFPNFCEMMGYEKFIDKKNYEVFNLSIGNGKETYIHNVDEYRFSEKINKTYLENLIHLLSTT